MRIRRGFLGTVLPSFFLLTYLTASGGDDAFKRKERAHAHLIEARRLAAEYKIDKAADRARDALKDDPTLAEAHVYIGMQRFRANDLKEAESELKHALEMDQYQAAAHCELGYVFYQMGQIEPATDHWTLSARLDPTSPHAFAGLALSHFKHGEEKEAAKTLEKALMYDKRFQDPAFLESEKGPKWSGQLLQDFKEMLSKAPKASYL
jgi:tetratricopeptide (TPR) repeat protein